MPEKSSARVMPSSCGCKCRKNSQKHFHYSCVTRALVMSRVTSYPASLCFSRCRSGCWATHCCESNSLSILDNTLTLHNKSSCQKTWQVCTLHASTKKIHNTFNTQFDRILQSKSTIHCTHIILMWDNFLVLFTFLCIKCVRTHIKWS